MVTPSLFRLKWTKFKAFSAPLLSIHSCVASQLRNQSNLTHPSTFMTVAPRSAAFFVATGPAQPMDRSMIIIPSRGVFDISSQYGILSSLRSDKSLTSPFPSDGLVHISSLPPSMVTCPPKLGGVLNKRKGVEGALKVSVPSDISQKACLYSN